MSDTLDLHAKPKWSHASQEPLEVIEASECGSMVGSHSTSRFRRVFNEIDALRAQVAELEERLDSERRDNSKGYNDRS